MPSQRKRKVPERFTFVHIDPQITVGRPWKRHSGVPRSHAAFWSRQTRTNSQSGASKGHDLHEFDDTACVHTAIGHGLTSFGPALSDAIPILAFCGENFPKSFFKGSNDDHALMISGYMLLSQAYAAALTGKGSKSDLLCRKIQLLNGINTRLHAARSSLTPQFLACILVLRSPLVCLTTHDLPGGLSFSEYVGASTSLCCIESASRARYSLQEARVHQQALHKAGTLLSMPTVLTDIDGLALMQYVSNSEAMYV